MARWKRNQADEAKFDAQLRREEDIKTEVILHLREHNKRLIATTGKLLSALIDAQNSLQEYRTDALARVEWMKTQTGDCIPGCTEHVWDSTDGWHRKEGSC